MNSNNKLTLNAFIPKASSPHPCESDFYSDLVRVTHNRVHFRVRGLYKAKNIQTLPHKSSLINQALTKGRGPQWLSRWLLSSVVRGEGGINCFGSQILAINHIAAMTPAPLNYIFKILLFIPPIPSITTKPFTKKTPSDPNSFQPVIS